MGEHARLGCSSSRWRYCPGSIREEAKYPDIPSAAAMDGTGSHLLLEMCLENGVLAADQYLGQTIGVGHEDSPAKMGWFIDGDRCRRVQIALDYVTRRIDELKTLHPDCQVIVSAESKSFPGRAYDRHDWWGTCDITIWVGNGSKTPFVEVIDYKDGFGYVSERNNDQLRDYLFGKVFHLHNPIDVGMTTIVQPKTNVPIRSETLNVDQLKRHGDTMIEAAKRTDDPDAPLIAGSHCKWCAHRDNCDAKKQTKIEKGAAVDSDIVKKVETELNTMPAVDLAKIIDAEEVIMAAFAKAKDEAKRRIEAGHPVPGYVIGPGRASTVWALSEDEVAKKLKGMKVKKDEMYPAKLISPAQAKKLPSLTDKQRENLEDLITTMAGKDVLKKGQSLPKQSAASMFDSLPKPESKKLSFL